MQYVVSMSILQSSATSGYHSSMFSSAVSIRAALTVTICFRKQIVQFIVKMSTLQGSVTSGYHSATFSSAVSIRAAFAITICFRL